MWKIDFYALKVSREYLQKQQASWGHHAWMDGWMDGVWTRNTALLYHLSVFPIDS